MGVTEGVSFDGCSGPTIYEPARFGSEIFEFLRSSGYTPSVSHSLDSSLREGAGNGLHHSTGYSLKSGVTGDFHRPYGVCHSTNRPETATLRAIFIAPTKGVCHSTGRFSSPHSTVGADMGGKMGGGMKIFYNKNRRPSTEGGLFYNSSNFNEKCRMVW